MACALRLSLALVLLSRLCAGAGSHQRLASGMFANPIRKVVTMLQSMQTKVTEEGDKEEELFKKFMCYCKTSGGTLKESIAAAETKGPQLDSEIEAAQEQKTQMEEDLKQHKADRVAAKEAMKEATAIREKEAAAFAELKGDQDANVEALNKAIKALETGAGGSFLQSSSANVLRAYMTKVELLEAQKQQVLAFLSGSEAYSPQSGEVIGILKQMGDEMVAGLAEATAAEESAVKNYDELMAAKKKEVSALTKSIETKTARVGELAVATVRMQNDSAETAAGLEEDKKFLAELEKGCDSKEAEWEERVKTRQDELLALAETIKVLNDDDALELFKKTLPSPAASSFMQIRVNARRIRALALQQLKQVSAADKRTRSQLDLIALALHGKKIGFEKVVSMIDEMVVTLKTEQEDDEKKKTYCGEEFDKSDDEKKALERTISDTATAIATAEEGIESLTEEIAALEAGIKALDKSVAEATENRKEEHAEFTELMASDAAAKELLGFAQNRLNKFYNPKLYVPPPKQELSREDQIVVGMGGDAPTTPAPGGIAGTGIAVLAQIASHTQSSDERVAPPPPPETFDAYSKKSEESNGVLAMIDLLVKDLTKEMAIAETEEKDAQADYETMMADSAEKRAQDSKSLTEKESSKADLEAELESHKAAEESTKKELMATEAYISSLHAECDWLLKYFDARKEARAGEIEALKNAKAVLSGADYSLLQRGRATGLGFLAKKA